MRPADRLTLLVAVVLGGGMVYLLAGRAQSPVWRDTVQPRGTGQRIDINEAGATSLQLLPGVGPPTAAKIISHRQTHGPFAEPADLEAVSGIGTITRKKIEPWVQGWTGE